jgi:hypothetical protein
LDDIDVPPHRATQVNDLPIIQYDDRLSNERAGARVLPATDRQCGRSDLRLHGGRTDGGRRAYPAFGRQTAARIDEVITERAASSPGTTINA